MEEGDGIMAAQDASSRAQSEVSKRDCGGDLWSGSSKNKGDDSHVQGRSHLCLAIRVEIDGLQLSKSYGVRILGLHGVGGIGKTTACEVLCNDYFAEFEGKVCHIVFDGGTKLQRLQKVVKRLTETNRDLIKDFSESECKGRLKDCLKKKKVLLAIDNVSDEYPIVDEAKDLLRVGFVQGSIVIVTARSLPHLRNLNLEDCIEMPELEEGDARSLFLYHAAPGSYLKNAEKMDERLMKQCIERCRFGKGDGINYHYHPLALKVLGGQLGNDPEEWIEKLNGLDAYNNYGGKEDDDAIFSIFTGSFKILNPEEQLLFMDAAIFSVRLYEDHYQPVYSMSIFEWLSTIHGKSLAVIKPVLKRLKDKSLLEKVGDGSHVIGMHDLWRKFALMKARGGQFDPRPWIFQEYGLYGRGSEESCLFGGGWESLQRINMVAGTIWGCSAKEINLDRCLNLRVLKLAQVYPGTGVLDVSKLKELKSLAILNYFSVPNLRIPGLGCLRNLVWLQLLGVRTETDSLCDEIGNLTSLHLLYVWDLNLSSAAGMLPDFSGLNLLRDVSFKYCGKGDMISGLSSEMTSLKRLNLNSRDLLRICDGVGDLVALEELDLSSCSRLEKLPDLGRLKNLLKLNLKDCELIEAVPGLDHLVSLQVFRAFGCSKLAELPDMRELVNLRELGLGDCELIEAVPGLGDLVSLQVFSADGCSRLAELPDMRELVNLQKLWVRQCPSMRAMRGLSDLIALEELVASYGGLQGCPGLRKLTKLERVSISGWSAEGLPCLSDLVNLKFLEIADAGVVDELSGLFNLPRLQEVTIRDCGFKDVSCLSNLTALTSLDVHHCHLLERLPDMYKLTRLEKLDIVFCESLREWKSGSGLRQFGADLHVVGTLLQIQKLNLRRVAFTELPDLSSFPQLRELSLWMCGKLTSLTSSAPLTALQRLDLGRCWSLRALPNLSHLVSLRYFKMEDCGVQLTAHETEKLEAMCPSLVLDVKRLPITELESDAKRLKS